MKRIVFDDSYNMILEDNLTGTEVSFDYIIPTQKDRLGYENECWKRKGKKSESFLAKARLKYGSKLLTGIREGDFFISADEHPGCKSGKIDLGNIPAESEKAFQRNGKHYVTISSSPQSAYYAENWLALVEKYRPDLIITFGAVIYDNPVETQPQD